MAPSLLEAESLHTIDSTTKPQKITLHTQSPPHEEYQYLNLIREILQNGEHRPDSSSPAPPPPSPSPPPGSRSGTATAAALISTPSASDREEGDLGPVYGFQWRHFGAQYVDTRTDYTGQGVDQVAEVIHKLRNNPYDRRIILSAWNPADLKKMALPPCHMFAQFYVSFPGARRGVSGHKEQSGEAQTQTQDTSGKGHLHCQLYQRSCDMGLGVPFNIASYALLTHLLAHACDLVPGSLTHVMGDAHVYADHVDALQVQLEREPRAFPTLEYSEEREARRGRREIDGWKVEDFKVVGYEPHKIIAMKMSV